MLILITNDDGFGAEGLGILKKMALSISEDVWTIAPASDVSGCGRSIMHSDPIRVECRSDKEFIVHGTTSLCVSIAIETDLLPRKPDLILSGVNSGANVGSDIMYSGTAGGAIEGLAGGIKSIAFSQYRKDKSKIADWGSVNKFGIKLLKDVLSDVSFCNFALNINFPYIDDFQGIKVVNQGNHLDKSRIKSSGSDDEKNKFYSYRSSRIFDGDGSVKALKDGFITITPLKLDLTSWKDMDSLGYLNNLNL